MRKLLIISPFLPWPLNSGGNIGVYNMLKAVSHNYDVHFVTSLNNVNTNELANQLNAKIPEINVHLYDWKSANNKRFEIIRKITRRLQQKMLFAGNVNALTFNLNDEITPGFIDFVHSIINEKGIDLIQVEFCQYLPWIYALPENVKKVFIHHELRFVRDEQAFGKLPYGRYIVDFARDNEISMLNRYDKIVSMTEIDKSKLESEGVKVPIYVSTSAISDKMPELNIGHSTTRLSFVGGSGHAPNYDGIKWFAQNVLPLVSKQIPDVKLEIIGSWTDAAKNEVLGISQNIEFRGFVPTLIDGIRDTLMVVPINIGSGIRMKILEAASNSVPFVSTVVGAEGLDFEHKKECMITDNPKEMASYIVSILNDSFLYSSLAKNAYEKYVQKYSFEAMKKLRLKVYE